MCALFMQNLCIISDNFSNVGCTEYCSRRPSIFMQYLEKSETNDYDAQSEIGRAFTIILESSARCYQSHDELRHRNYISIQRGDFSQVLLAEVILQLLLDAFLKLGPVFTRWR